MPQRQVISVHTDGKVSGLQRKPGEGFDLSTLGNASIVRASEIIWSKDKQKWYIKIMVGKYAGQLITERMCEAANIDTPLVRGDLIKDTSLFGTYEAAVRAEIHVLDHIRRTEGHKALAT